MDPKWIRTQMLLGPAGMEKLKNSRVVVFGIGGVGSFAAEALIRSGVGRILLFDHDKISMSNINRQIHADVTTVGLKKIEVMGEHLKRINPEAEIETDDSFFLPGQEEKIPSDCSYIVDAIDTVTAKIALVLEAKRRGIPIISSMGTGNKLDPTQLEIADIYETSICPLAKVMRKELKKRGVEDLKVVYSKEIPIFNHDFSEEAAKFEDSGPTKRQPPGSVPFVPSVAGLIIASAVVKQIVEG